MARSAPGDQARRGWAGWALGRLLATGLLVVWAFVLGVLVGQGTLGSPEQLNDLRTLASDWPLVGDWLKEDAPPQPEKMDNLNLTFYNDLQRRSRDKEAARPPAQAKAGPNGQEAKTPAGKTYSVQVASFGDEAQAQRLAQRLKASGLAAYVLRTEVEGLGVRHRVRVGSFSDFEQARAAAAHIRQQERLAAYVTQGE